MGETFLNLEDQLAFYKAYHNNTPNVFIHSIFVPTILFTTARILNDVQLFHGYTLAHALAFGYGLFYIALDARAGMLAAVLLTLMCQILNNDAVKFSARSAWALFVVSWIFQFIGHGIFEKRKPALLDNLVQSLVLAPFFILYELLFLLGFMPELKSRLQTRVDRELQLRNGKHS